MPSHNKKVFYSDLVFRIPKNVYEPAEDTYLMADNLEVSPRDTVLDLGTGCGILGILSASRASMVLATDLNPHAIRCAKENAQLNEVVRKMHFLQTDLFGPLRREPVYDVILFNPPYLPVEPSRNGSWLDAAWTGGTSGRQVTDRFISEAPKHLKKSGSLFLVQSSLSGIDETVSALEQKQMKVTVAAKRACPFFETLALLHAEYLTH